MLLLPGNKQIMWLQLNPYGTKTQLIGSVLVQLNTEWLSVIKVMLNMVGLFEVRGDGSRISKTATFWGVIINKQKYIL